MKIGLLKNCSVEWARDSGIILVVLPNSVRILAQEVHTISFAQRIVQMYGGTLCAIK
jgi:hypothetical protein